MATQGKVIALPDLEEMRKRLEEVSDVDHVRERFFPLLLKYAGSEKVGMGIVMLLALAINDYTEGMPATIATLMWMDAERYIDALTDDEDVRAEAKQHLEQVLGH